MCVLLLSNGWLSPQCFDISVLATNPPKMVKLFSLSIFYKHSDEAKLLKTASDLQSFSFFQRSSVAEFMK